MLLQILTKIITKILTWLFLTVIVETVYLAVTGRLKIGILIDAREDEERKS